MFTIEPGVSYTIEAKVATFDGNGKTKFIFDFNDDIKGAVIQFVNIELKESEILKDVFFLGHEFCSDVSEEIRKEFIKQMKGLSKSKIDYFVLEQFLTEPIRLLGNKLNRVGCVLYPTSTKDQIRTMIVDYLWTFAPTRNFVSIEFFKRETKDIFFAIDLFNAKTKTLSNNAHEIMSALVEETFAQFKVTCNSGFSLPDTVPRSLRKYVWNFLYFNEKITDFVKYVWNKDILIVDDANTSLSALREILRLIKLTARPRKIMIVACLGKNYQSLMKLSKNRRIKNSRPDGYASGEN